MTIFVTVSLSKVGFLRSFNWKLVSFFFFFAPVSRETDDKNGSFCDLFWKNVETLDSFMKL